MSKDKDRMDILLLFNYKLIDWEYKTVEPFAMQSQFDIFRFIFIKTLYIYYALSVCLLTS